MQSTEDQLDVEANAPDPKTSPVSPRLLTGMSAAIAVLLPLWILRRLFFGDGNWVILGDSPQLYYPDLVLLSQALSDGVFPLWDPWERLGDPFFTDPQSGIFYPINYLFIVVAKALGGDPSYLLFELKTVFHLSLGSLGLFSFARVGLKLPRIASVFGAVVFVTGPFFVSHLAHCLLWPYVYAPWILLLLERLSTTSEGTRRRLVGLLAIVTGTVITAQSPPAAYYVIVTACLYAAYVAGTLAFERHADRRYAIASAARYIGWGLLALIMGLMMGLVVAGPAFEHLDYSVLSDRTFSYVSGGHMRTKLWTALTERPGKEHEEQWIYMGTIVVVATLAAPALAFQRRSAALFWTLTACFFVTLTTLDYDTLRWWYDYAPGGNLFRIPSRYVAISQIAAACACALAAGGIQEGAQHLLERGRSRLQSGVLLAPWMPQVVAVGAAFAVAIPAGFVVADQAPRYGLYRVKNVRKPLFHRDQYAADLNGAKRDFRLVNDGYIYVGGGDRFRLRDARGYNHNFVVRRHRAFLKALRPGGKTNLLRLVGAKLYAQHPKNLLAAVDRAHLRPEFESLKPHLLRLKGAVMPAAFVVDTVREGDAKIARRDVETRKTYQNYAVIENASQLDLTNLKRQRGIAKDARQEGATPWPGYAPAKLETLSHHRAEISVDGPGGLLVYNAMHYPGWVAYVDGVRQPAVPANYLQMATPVPPGPHTVVFAFETTWLKWPLYFALLALFAAVALIVGGSEHTRRNRDEEDGLI